MNRLPRSCIEKGYFSSTCETAPFRCLAAGTRWRVNEALLRTVAAAYGLSDINSLCSAAAAAEL
jgi:hypothetical protein